MGMGMRSSRACCSLELSLRISFSGVVVGLRTVVRKNEKEDLLDQFAGGEMVIEMDFVESIP